MQKQQYIQQDINTLKKNQLMFSNFKIERSVSQNLSKQ